MGGRIVGVAVLAVGGPLALVQELHSTKGWRVPIRVSVEKFGWAPVIGGFSWAEGCGPSKTVAHLDRVVSERELWRHGWYRRKMRKEAGLEELHADV